MGAKNVAQQAYAAFSEGNIPGIVDLVADDVEWTSPETLPQGGSFKGRDGVIEFFQGVGASWSSLKLTVDTLDDLTGEIAVGVVRLAGTLASGTPGHYGAAHVFTVADGKITNFREYVDVDAAITA